MINEAALNVGQLLVINCNLVHPNFPVRTNCLHVFNLYLKPLVNQLLMKTVVPCPSQIILPPDSLCERVSDCVSV